MTAIKNSVVINTCYGGFGLSMAALRRLSRWLGMSIDDVRDRYIFAPKQEVRHCPFLVRVVREMEHRSWGDCARLSIVEITGNQYFINEYDGLENIETPDTMLWTQVLWPYLMRTTRLLIRLMMNRSRWLATS